MSTQAIVVTFEFKLEYDKQELNTKKKQAAASIINVTVLNIIAAENAVIKQSSNQMYNYFKFEQNSVDQKYQKSDLRKKDKKQSSLNSTMTKMMMFQQKQMKMNMQQHMFDSMNCFQRSQNLHE